MNDSARRDKRFASKQELLVHCESWSEFARLYASDISRGGMFVVTEETLPILTEIDVDIHLPESHRVLLRASVVHVLDAQQAARESRSPGVGVQFVALSAVQKEQIQQLVEFARIEGDNPSASYASRLFERSTSLPPSKILGALPADESSLRPSSRSSTRSVADPNRERSMQPAARNSAPAGSQPPSTGSQLRATQRPKTGEHAAPQTEGDSGAAVQPQAPAAPPKPLDMEKLKLGMTHLAHKRFEHAIKTFREIATETHGDRQALQWLYTTHARLLLRSDDEQGAAEHYQKVLDVDEANHEARKFVREYHTKKRLNSLPFGRYFVKK